MIQSIILLSVILQQFSHYIEMACSTTITTITTTWVPTTESIKSTTLAPAEQFFSFQEKYNLNYENETVAEQKFAIFKTNLEEIEKHNAAAEAGNISFTLVVNQFADLV